MVVCRRYSNARKVLLTSLNSTSYDSAPCQKKLSNANQIKVYGIAGQRESERRVLKNTTVRYLCIHESPLFLSCAARARESHNCLSLHALL